VIRFVDEVVEMFLRRTRGFVVGHRGGESLRLGNYLHGGEWGGIVEVIGGGV
jgi:hypothetical protein